MKCYYHKDDFDGICSAAIVNKICPDVNLVPADYKTIPEGKNDSTVIVDLSFPKATMQRLINNNTSVVWIDHHKSALEMLHDLNIAGKREVGVGACLLVWEYYFPYNLMPLPVQYLADYDVWKLDNKNAEPFNFGLRAYKEAYDPKSKLWEQLLQDVYASFNLINEIISTGSKILQYKEVEEEQYAKGMAYTTEFAGYSVLAVNAPMKNSSLVKSMYNPKLHEFVVLFGVKQNDWKYSLFSLKPEMDVSKIAVEYGGGGHKNAAGFYSAERLV